MRIQTQLLLFWAFSIIVSASCKKNIGNKIIPLGGFEVLNDTSVALTARLQFHLNTPSPVLIKYQEKDGNQMREIKVSNARKEHNIPLFKLKENALYEYEVYTSANDNALVSLSGKREFKTASVPAWIKDFYREDENQISETDKGYYLFTSLSSPGCIYIVDHTGRVVWYRSSPNIIKVAKFTKNHTLLTLEDENKTPFGDGNIILETTLAGDTLFFLKKGQKGFDRTVHHDLELNQHGNIIAVTTVLKSGIPGDGLIKLDRAGNKIWEWSTFDAGLPEAGPIVQPWINSVSLDIDNHYIISLRGFSQVWKIHSTTGKILWTLGKGGTIEQDEHSEFLYQHYAHRSVSSEIMLFDNGRAERPQSRILSFSLDEKALKAETKLNIGLPAEYYSNIMGSAALLPDGNILAASAVNGAVLKINPGGNILWKLKTNGLIYRAEYIENPFGEE